MQLVYRIDFNERLVLTLVLAIGMHAMAIWGISFEFERPSPSRSDSSLEIIVVRNTRDPEAVEKPEFLAQTSQQGSSNSVVKTRPKVAAPGLPVPTPSDMASPPARIPQVTERPREPHRKVITQKSAPRKRVAYQPEPKPPEKKILPSAAQILASSSQEIARITAALDLKTEAYSQRPRRRHISASTQEYKYAAYLEAWRKKIERIGNLNYPDQAKRRKLYGNLVLHVAVKADGSVERISIRKSSGYKILDDAAISIVRLAAPFAPFPREIREETDILDITRTWQFLNNNRLGWK
jgi:protein TonB